MEKEQYQPMPEEIKRAEEIAVENKKEQEIKKLEQSIFDLTNAIILAEEISDEDYKKMPPEKQKLYSQEGENFYARWSNDLSELDLPGNKATFINEDDFKSAEESYGLAKAIIEGGFDNAYELPKKESEEHEISKGWTKVSHSSAGKELGTVEYDGKKFKIYEWLDYDTNNQFSGWYNKEWGLVAIRIKE